MIHYELLSREIFLTLSKHILCQSYAKSQLELLLMINHSSVCVSFLPRRFKGDPILSASFANWKKEIMYF